MNLHEQSSVSTEEKYKKLWKIYLHSLSKNAVALLHNIMQNTEIFKDIFEKLLTILIDIRILMHLKLFFCFIIIFSLYILLCIFTAYILSNHSTNGNKKYILKIIQN